MRWILGVLVVLLIGGFIFLETYTPALSDNHGNIEARLYLGEGEAQPLVVGFGGGEGGNAWASNYWKETRDRFIEEGYAFLAVGYFGREGISEGLDRVSLNAIYDSIMVTAKHPMINGQKIALIGGSKGAELALNLASRYPEFGAVVGMVPSHVSFPATNFSASTSSWTFNGEEVPYVPMTWSAVPPLLKRDMRGSFAVMLEDEEAVANAAIHVERISGPILLLSATRDELWPSTEMSNSLVTRLEAASFPHHYEHLVIEGGHGEPLKHFDRIFEFLSQHFKG